jgi:[acyl-carrier-protein] S-malonyltransferase
VLVITAPGQGSQTVGFLKPWLELPSVADRVGWLGAVAGLDLARLGTTAGEDELRDTAVAQPLIVAAGLVSLLELFPHPGDAYGRVGVGAGHSVGEVTAAAAAGVITAEQAMVLVRERGRTMAAASAATPTGMSAVLGGDPREVLDTLTQLGLEAANINGAGQVVAAGSLPALAELSDNPPARSRVRPLSVAGAFHTDYMTPARDELAQLARAVTTHDPRIRLVSNADGTVVHDGREVLRRLVTQVSHPVRWDLCQQTFLDLGVSALLEIPPAGTLTGLARRTMPGVETVALRTPDDLDAARALIAEHGSPSPLDGFPTWRLVVSPAKGQVRRHQIELGDQVGSGAPVAVIQGLRDAHEVVAAHGGTAVEWLVEDGDPVGPGQPLLRVHPLEPLDAHGPVGGSPR